MRENPFAAITENHLRVHNCHGISSAIKKLDKFSENIDTIHHMCIQPCAPVLKMPTTPVYMNNIVEQTANRSIPPKRNERFRSEQARYLRFLDIVTIVRIYILYIYIHI